MPMAKPAANTPQKLQRLPSTLVLGQGVSAGLQSSSASSEVPQCRDGTFGSADRATQLHTTNTSVRTYQRPTRASQVAVNAEVQRPSGSNPAVRTAAPHARSLSSQIGLADPIIDFDEDADPIIDLDEISDPIIDLDGNSDPIIDSDEDADPIIESDEDTNPIKDSDEDADPIEDSDEDSGEGGGKRVCVDCEEDHEDDWEDDVETDDRDVQLHDTNYYAVEDVFSDSDTSVLSEDEYQVPEVIRIAEVEAENAAQQTANQSSPGVHRRYKGFLKALCDSTATSNAYEYAFEGLVYAITTAKSLELQNEMKKDQNLDLYGFALVIHVWQIVCLRLQHGQYPAEGPRNSLSTFSGAYFISAHCNIVIRCSGIAISHLKFAVEYWEQRLGHMGGGNQWLKDRWAKDIAQVDEDPAFHRNTTAAIYSETIENSGFIGLTRVILEEEAKMERGSQTQLRTMAQLSKESREEARIEMVQMFYSMDRSLIKAIIQGQLPRLSRVPSGPVYHSLERLNKPNPIQPGIYMNSICDRMGLSPSPAQWRKACQIILQYVQPGMDHNDMAANIDQLIHPRDEWPRALAAKGLRRYMDWRSWTINNRSTLDETHRKMARYFIDQLQIRMSDDKDHVPLAVPVVELGFSNDPSHRLREHRHHKNSNYLMNLAEAVFEYQYPGLFTLQQHVIYRCWRPLQTWMGEIVFTQLAQGYVDGGGGFSHEPAGRSNSSSFRTLSKKQWEAFEIENYKVVDLKQRVNDDQETQKRHVAQVVEASRARTKVLETQLAWLESRKRLREALAKLAS